MVQTGEKKCTVFVNAEMDIVFFFGFIIFHLMYAGRWSSKTPSNCKFLGFPVGIGGGPQSPDDWSSCNAWQKIREGEVDDDKSMVNDVEGVQNLYLPFAFLLMFLTI